MRSIRRFETGWTILGTALSAGLLIAMPSPSHGQRTETVRFAGGDFGTMIEGEVSGRDYVDYRIDVAAGQTLYAELTSPGSAYFNVLPPGSDNVAIYNSSTLGNTVRDLPLGETGPYTIRVYLMGNDRDTGATRRFNVDLSIQ